MPQLLPSPSVSTADTNSELQRTLSPTSGLPGNLGSGLRLYGSWRSPDFPTVALGPVRATCDFGWSKSVPKVHVQHPKRVPIRSASRRAELVQQYANKGKGWRHWTVRGFFTRRRSGVRVPARPPFNPFVFI